MAKTIEVVGAKRVARGMEQMGDRAVRLEPALDRSAEFAERQIQGVPVRTGRLAASIRGGAEQLLTLRDDGYDLGSAVDYSRHVFEGTKYMRARPPRINAAAIANNGADEINQHLKP